jgi:hypothetical protein
MPWDISAVTSDAASTASILSKAAVAYSDAALRHTDDIIINVHAHMLVK